MILSSTSDFNSLGRIAYDIYALLNTSHRLILCEFGHCILHHRFTDAKDGHDIVLHVFLLIKTNMF